MSTSQTALPVKMPAGTAAGPRKVSEGARSSRRRGGSTGPPVLLGGGVGVLGNASTSAATLPALYNKPVTSPATSTFSSSHATPSVPAALPASSTTSIMSKPKKSSRAPVSKAVEEVRNGSVNSLSTAASTSSQTLKTPASKLDQVDNAKIAGTSSAGSHDEHGTDHGYTSSPTPAMPLNARRAKQAITLQSSPTPLKVQKPLGDRAPLPSPAFTHGPLPPTPSDTHQSKPAAPTQAGETDTAVSSKADAGRHRNVTAPAVIETTPPRTSSADATRQQNRLSQDWVQISFPEPFKHSMQQSAQRVRQASAPFPVSQSAAEPKRLPQPQMIPLKHQVSPQRPNFERTHTAPPTSPAKENGTQGRASLDQLRPGPVASEPRKRLISMSTPPEAATEQATSGRLSSWHFDPQARRPELQTRKSVDVLRPSTDSSGVRSLASGTKASKNGQRNVLAGLGLGAPPRSADAPAGEASKKLPGLSLKKSSGALKAWFKSGSSKDKEKQSLPPMPGAEPAKSRPSESLPRPAFSRSVTPGSTDGSPALSQRSKTSTVQGSPDIGRLSMGYDRALPGGSVATTMSRTASQGNEPIFYSQLPAQQRPADWVPPRPPRSPLPGTESAPSAPVQLGPAVPGATREQPRPAQPTAPITIPIDEGSQPQQMKLGEGLPSSSLPYLDSTRFSRILDDRPTSIVDPAPPSSSSSATTARPSPSSLPSLISGDDSAPDAELSSSMTSTASLHLLSLPELDLDLGFSFDTITKPSTPGCSPHRRSPSSPATAGRGSPLPMHSSPQRSHTLTGSPSRTKGRQELAERNVRRRSRGSEVQAVGNKEFWHKLSPAGDTDMFASPSMACLLSSSNSFSGPHFGQVPPVPRRPSSGVEETTPANPVVEVSHQHTDSLSSEQSVPSSGENITASSQQTPTSSPPLTPEQTNYDPSIHEAELRQINAPVSPALTLEPEAEVRQVIAQKLPLDEAYESFAAPLAATLSRRDSPASLLEPAAEIKPVVQVEPIVSDKAGVRLPRSFAHTLSTSSRIVQPDETMPTRQLVREIERVLYSFRYPSSNTDRFGMIRVGLLPLLQEIDRRPMHMDPDKAAGSQLREVLFQWSELFLSELRVEQAANERGACLEGLASVMESAALSDWVLQRSGKRHQEMFTHVMVEVTRFVMGKLGAKGVFHNTLLFSGRFLAFAFFRVPHIAEQLVAVLQPPRGLLARFTMGALDQAPLPSHAQPHYPPHLAELCLDNPRAYTSRLQNLTPEFTTAAELDAFVFQPGNWLRRWQSDDSELFPAFYRSYHRLLSVYLAPAVEHFESLGQPLPVSMLLRAPGYAHLGAIFAKKCHSYILGSINAVTTSSSAQHFDANENAGFKGSQKPAVLETANRRLVETLATLINSKVTIPTGDGRVIEVDGSQMWGTMLDHWTKSLISRTSLYAPKGVFCLLDLLDGIVDPPFDHATGARDLRGYSLLDVPHLIYTMRLIFEKAEHALTLVKAIAFVFTHWEVLTSRPEDRRELCLELLLEKALFERLLLFWSQSVRSYVLRLVVFRLAHLHTKAEDGEAHEIEVESVRLLQTRLDRIRQRYDELEPRAPPFEASSPYGQLSAPATPVGGSFPRSESTIKMITDSPRHSGSKAEKLLGLGLGVEEKDEKKGSRASSWLRKGFGGGKKKRRDSKSTSPSPSPSLGASPSMSPSPAASPMLGPSPNPNSSIRTSSPNLLAPSPGFSARGASPTLGGSRSPTLPGPNDPGQKLRKAPPAWPPVMQLPSPSSSGSRASQSDTSPTEMSLAQRQNRDPVTPTLPPPTTPTMGQPQVPSINIAATSPSSDEAAGAPTSPMSPRSKFEFELPLASPRSDTFDPSPSPVPSSPRRASAPPSPAPPSPHMSRSFSKRSSLLPPSTAKELERESMLSPRSKADAAAVGQRTKKPEVEEGYDRKLHAYAIRMLAELEDAQKEYDEWWADGGVGKTEGCPPRLSVAWPFHEGED